MQFGFDIVLGGEAHCITGMYYDVNAVAFVETNDNRALSCRLAIPIGKLFKIARFNKYYKATKQTTKVVNGTKKTVTTLEPVGSVVRKPLQFGREGKIKHVYDRHQNDWGYAGVNRNKAIEEAFSKDLIAHVYEAENVYSAIHRSEPALFYTKKGSDGLQLAVITDRQNNLISAFKLSPNQFANVEDGLNMYAPR